jgi:hypothetical protein
VGADCQRPPRADHRLPRPDRPPGVCPQSGAVRPTRRHHRYRWRGSTGLRAVERPY